LRKRLKQLPETFKSDEISALDNSLLKGVQKEQLTARISERRKDLFVYLVDDGYITSEKYQTAKEQQGKIYPKPEYKPLTTGILNKYIDLEIEKINEVVKKQNANPKNKLKYDLIENMNPQPVKDLEEWLKEQGGYRMDDEPKRRLFSRGN
jgi:hypothetical protein